MTRECSIDRAALLKILLHAAKYPTTAVNGLLIGKAGPASTHVFDAIPVCHNFITLTPVLECALAQVAEHAKQQPQKDVRIVGYYQCNERFEDTELSGPGKKFADRIEQLYPDSVAVVLDAPVLQRVLEAAGSSGGGEGGSSEAAADDGDGSDAAALGKPARPLLALYVKDGARGWAWASGGSSQLAKWACPMGGVGGLVAQYTAEGRHRRLADFEDHLADISRDWLNEKLLE